MQCFFFYLQHVNHPGVVNLEEMFETPERVSNESFPLIGSFEWRVMYKAGDQCRLITLVP